MSTRPSHGDGGAYDRLRPEEAALAERPLAELTDAELERWHWACFRLSKRHPSWFRRWRWRRQWHRALAAWSRRVGARVGQGPPLCQRCGTQRPTVHVVYGHGTEQHAGHFCAQCSKLEPPGWFVRAEAGGGGSSAR